MQVLWLSFVMIPLYALNQQLIYATFKALDVGGSISIHAFGAYYGLAASLVLSRCAAVCSCDHLCLEGNRAQASQAVCESGTCTRHFHAVRCRDQEQYTSVHPKNSGSYTRCTPAPPAPRESRCCSELLLLSDASPA